MAQRYGHISTDARRAAMEAMNASRRNVADATFDSQTALVEKEGSVH